MLRVAGVQPLSKPSWLSVGEDQLFDARWERPGSSIVFWQIDAAGQNLMIAIDETTGAIMSIDPVIVHGASVQHGTRLPAIEERLGSPLFDKRDLAVYGAGGFVITDAEVRSFRILFDDAACTIVWAEPRWIMRSGRVLFGVSGEGYLAAVGVDGMNADESGRVAGLLSRSTP